jgi:ABC-type histidine transport system ATPase subunit
MDELVETPYAVRPAGMSKDKPEQSGLSPRSSSACIARTIAIKPDIILMDEPACHRSHRHLEN